MKWGIVIIFLSIGAFWLGSVVFSPKACAKSCGVEEFEKMMESGEYTILDVRTQEEYETGHLKNAKQIDYYKTDLLKNYLNNLDKNGKYLVYCRTGRRSGEVLTMMQQMGFKNTHDLAGGITAWAKSGGQIAKE